MCCCIYIGAICEHFRFMYECAMENVEQNRNEKDPQQYKRRKLLINEQMNRAVEIHSKIFEYVFGYNWIWFNVSKASKML